MKWILLKEGLPENKKYYNCKIQDIPTVLWIDKDNNAVVNNKGDVMPELMYDQIYYLDESPSPSLSAEHPTVGSLITEAIRLHELNPDKVEKELKLSKGLLQDLMNDNFYTNSVPIVTFKNLLLSLNVPFRKIEPVMLPTFRLMLSKETPESIKKKPHGYQLWENEESILKYTKRLKELMCPSLSAEQEAREYAQDKVNKDGTSHAYTGQQVFEMLTVAYLAGKASGELKEGDSIKKFIHSIMKETPATPLRILEAICQNDYNLNSKSIIDIIKFGAPQTLHQ